MTYLVSSLQSASSLYISFGVLVKLVSLLVVTGEKLIPCLTDKEVKISRARLHCFLPSFSTNDGEFCTGRFFPRGSAGISRRKSSKPKGNIDQNLND